MHAEAPLLHARVPDGKRAQDKRSFAALFHLGCMQCSIAHGCDELTWTRATLRQVST